VATTQLELEAASASGANVQRPLSRHERWIDLVLVLTVALWRPLLSSTVAFVHPESIYKIPYSRMEEAVGASVLVYVLWRRRAGISALKRSLRLSDLIDVALVLAIAFWWPLLTSAIDLLRPRSIYFGYYRENAWYSLIEEAVGLAVLAYVLRKRRAGLTAITQSLHWRDIGTGLALCAAANMAEYTLYYLTGDAWRLPHPSVPVHIPGLHAGTLWLAFQFVNPWFEELIVRGFLMTEMTALCGAPTAVIVSTLVQTSYHLYQGSLNAAMLSICFLAFSIYFAHTRRLGPVIAAHTIMDVWGYVSFIGLLH
jgi:membrane protease YdiL (CAAX protease family)